jgi:PAS domain S-box-containing protein
VIRRANRNVSEVLGYDPRELEGETVETLLRKEDREHHVGFRREYMESPEPRPMGSDLDLYAHHEDGTDVPVEISLGPVERNGELLVVATLSDVSDRKRRERELQRQNDRLEEFASIVSHDLQNPLSIAEGRLRLARLARQECECECGSEHLEHVERALDRMGLLIEDLLALAREGERVADFERVDLSTVVDDCWQNVDTREATLVVETERTLRADRQRLQQLLENLVHNAVEHGVTTPRSQAHEHDESVETADEGVTVTVGDLDDGFYVADDGSGIPEDERRRVFDRGYTTSKDGTGFGLAIVEEVAEAHGWEVRVTASASDGARFEVTDVA